MKKYLYLFGSFTLAISTLVSCAPKLSSSNNSIDKNSIENLYKYQWKLKLLNGKTMLNNTGLIPFLVFTDSIKNIVTGNTGCNTLRGTLILTSTDSMRFSPLAVTRRACINDNYESEFLSSLARVDKLIVDNNELLLFDNDKMIAAFDAEKENTNVSPTTSTKITGSWQLNYISGTKIAFDGLYPDKKPFLKFNENGSDVGGNTGCNSFSAQIKMNAASITFSDLLSTMMACPGEGEKNFVEMIKKVTKYNLSEDVLTLLIDDIAVMRFKKM